MSTLLHIDSSPLYGRSVSRELTSAFVAQWKALHPDGRVIDRDLNATAMPPINAEWVGAVYTPEQARTPQQKKLLSLSDSLLAELEQADEYVIGVPMHNLTLRAYGIIGPELVFHSGYVSPESTAQCRNRFSKQLGGLLPRIAGVAQGQNRAASLAEPPHNLLKLKVSADLAAPVPVDCPFGELFRPAHGFESLDFRHLPIEGSLVSKDKETIYFS
jgi:hypothetical protein